MIHGLVIWNKPVSIHMFDHLNKKEHFLPGLWYRLLPDQRGLPSVDIAHSSFQREETCSRGPPVKAHAEWPDSYNRKSDFKDLPQASTWSWHEIPWKTWCGIESPRLSEPKGWLHTLEPNNWYRCSIFLESHLWSYYDCAIWMLLVFASISNAISFLRLDISPRVVLFE